jgi:hypothetical protein
MTFNKKESKALVNITIDRMISSGLRNTYKKHKIYVLFLNLTTRTYISPIDIYFYDIFFSNYTSLKL